MKLQDYMDKKPVLETGQLILRPLQVSDVADLKERYGKLCGTFSSLLSRWENL